VNVPRIVVTINGPGELMGWGRPFLRAVFELAPDAEVTVVFVPCPYATGHEADQTRAMFPAAKVVDPRAYARFLLRKPIDGMQRGHGGLQYLGGDLFHATTIARRLGMRAMTYKFSKRSYAQCFARFFALDQQNAASFVHAGAPPDRVKIVGNLVPDSVLGSLTEQPPPAGVGAGVCIMPGSRPKEIKYALPFFLNVARELRRVRPAEKITFALSPFNSDD
jgi:lipid-A-disaccharide synthase